MFKDAIDQMKDDEYIDKLHRQINGLKSYIEMVDQQNLSIMKTAEKFKCKSEKLEQQNKHHREELEILGEVINSASNADELNREYEKLKALEGESNG